MALPFRSRKSYGKEVQSLGEGSYGKVILTDQDYAIKMMATDDDDVITPSSLHEIVSLLKVSSPYVIPAIDVIIGKEYTSLVLPLADATLSHIIQNTTLDVRSIATQLCLGLADIHNANLLHLDLKPENLLLHGVALPTGFTELFEPQTLTGWSNAQLWIADLGISRIHTCAFPPLREEFFTLWYRAPEILLGGPVTAKADVWAIGVILAELFIAQKQGSHIRLLPGDSEIDELFKIFQLLGTPTTGALTTLPDWKPTFPQWQDTLLQRLLAYNVDVPEIALVSYLLNLDYTQRPTIFDVLRHPWFGQIIPRPQLTCLEALQLYAHYPPNRWDDQPDVSFDNRTTLIDWLDEVSGKFKLTPESLALAVYLIDRYISLKSITRSKLQLLGCACLFLGACFYEKYTPEANDFIWIAAKTFTKEDIRKMVNAILKLTSFDLAAVTSWFFLSNALLTDPTLRDNVVYIWRASLVTESHFLPPEQVANAILVLADESLPLTSDAVALHSQIMKIPAKMQISTAKAIIASRI